MGEVDEVYEVDADVDLAFIEDDGILYVSVRSVIELVNFCTREFPTSNTQISIAAKGVLLDGALDASEYFLGELLDEIDG